jgi:glucan phosphoethanolaminetransferase (alkaline phosphatase superfamily)
MDFLPQNAAHWHTIIVHFPAFALLFSLALLLIAAALKDGRFQRVALVFIILTAASVYFVGESGEKAEDIVEQLEGVEESYIHDHEEAAEIAIWITMGLGAVSLIMLLATMKQKVFSGKVVLLLLVLILVAVGALSYAAKFGGQIHHPENRSGFIGPDRWGGDDDSGEDE